jgi:hypothetical protein
MTHREETFASGFGTLDTGIGIESASDMTYVPRTGALDVTPFRRGQY